MKKFFLILMALACLFVSCSDGSSSGSDPEVPNIPAPKAQIVFDNTYGVCTAFVYNDYRRRSEDKIAEVPAGQLSGDIELSPSASEPFYFAYLLTLNGVSDFTVNYVPKNGKDQKAVRIDANVETTVVIPKLDDTFSSMDQMLSSRSTLLLQNESTNSFELHRGASSLRPDNKSDSPVVNSREKAIYTINTSDTFDPGAKVVSNYRLLAGAEYKIFPGSPDRFEPGHFYSYTFDGNLSLDSQIPISLDNVIVKTYTVNFNANGASGTVPATQTVKAGSVIKLPSGNGLTKNGFTFGGWNLAASGTEINYSADVDYLATSDITLYAKWHPVGTVTYNVSFNSNGGNATASQNIVSGSTAFRPLNPVRTGYEFVNWFGDSSLTTVYNFSSPITGNTNIYAKWDAVLYTITFNTNGASGQVPEAKTINAGSAITLPSGNGFSKAGHTFGGWSTDDSGTEDIYSDGASYRPDGDITLFAEWNALPYTVSFNSNGGNNIPSQTVYYGSLAARPADPVKDGYIFVNWYGDSNLANVYDFSSPVTGNITLHAKYTFEWFQVLFLSFNKQYDDSIISGESHYYRFYVTNGASYAFTSSLSSAVRYESGDAFWFNLTSGSVNQTAGQSGWAYIKIDNPAAYSLRIKHPEAGVSAFSISGTAGNINEADKTITVRVPSGTNITSLTPSVTPASGWTCATTGANNFTSPIEYAFVKDDITQIYRVIVILN